MIPYGGKETYVNPYEVLVGKGKWVAALNGAIPDGAIICGWEANGTPLYTTRAKYQSGVHPGKVRKEFGAAAIPYGGQEVYVHEYEVLVAD
ncbi:MAG TPA: DM9 repeat-containing protein [Ruminiclostridium sp.]|nr:DM9 repeat-containing protein [Ruminiclostridium sp.]